MVKLRLGGPPIQRLLRGPAIPSAAATFSRLAKYDRELRMRLNAICTVSVRRIDCATIPGWFQTPAGAVSTIGTGWRDAAPS